MNDYTKMIERIKLSEFRVANVAKEIKEFEGEIKKLDEELEISKAKESQIAEEIKYKKKIVMEKEWELISLKRSNETWKSILKEKEDILEEKKEGLEMTQNKVWSTRREFYDQISAFLSKNNFLSDLNKHLEVTLNKFVEQKNTSRAIESLEAEINSTEKEYERMNKDWESIQHLEKEKEELIDYEQSLEMLSLTNEIADCTRELEIMEKEVVKFTDRMSKPRDSPMTDYHLGVAPSPSREDKENSLARGITQVQEKKSYFIAKTASPLIRRQATLKEMRFQSYPKVKGETFDFS